MARTVDDIIAGGGDDQVMSTLSNIANVIAMIPERRARAAQQRAAMEQQQQSLAIRNDELRLRQQQAAEQQAAKQRAAEIDAASAAIMKDGLVDGPRGGKVPNRQAVIENAVKMGLPPERLASILSTFDKIEESAGKAEKERLGHVADLIDGVLEHGADDSALTLGMAVGKANNWLRDDELAPIMEAMASGKDIKPMLSQIRDSIRGPKKHETKVVGDALVTETGDVLYQGQPKPTNPTEATIAMQAAGGDAAKALGLMKQPPPMSAYQAEQLKLARAREAREAAKPAGESGAKLSATAVEKLAGIDQSLGVIGSLEKLKKDEWLGPIAGRAASMSLGVPGMSVSNDLARFAAETATLKNSVIKSVTGAAMSEPEAKRIMSQIPDFTDKPNVWQQKLNATRDNLSMLKKRTLELSGGVATDAPTKPRIKMVRDKNGNIVREQ